MMEEGRSDERRMAAFVWGRVGEGEGDGEGWLAGWLELGLGQREEKRRGGT